MAFFFPRFFAWLLEIFAQYVLQLDLKLDTLGLFGANGIEIKFNNGLKIVSGNCKLHEFSSLYVGLWCERLRVWSSAKGPFFKGSGNLQWQAVKAVLFSWRWGFLPKWNYLPKKQNESVRVPELSSLTFILYFKIWLTDCELPGLLTNRSLFSRLNVVWASWKPNHWKGFDLVLLW